MKTSGAYTFNQLLELEELKMPMVHNPVHWTMFLADVQTQLDVKKRELAQITEPDA